jgi:hypothetical protein
MVMKRTSHMLKQTATTALVPSERMHEPSAKFRHTQRSAWRALPRECMDFNHAHLPIRCRRGCARA